MTLLQLPTRRQSSAAEGCMQGADQNGREWAWGMDLAKLLEFFLCLFCCIENWIDLSLPANTRQPCGDYQWKG